MGSILIPATLVIRCARWGAELVRRIGYDAKNAAHLIRLLRMGIEFLSEGTMHVERADAPELLEIKRGAWPLEKVKAEAERLFHFRKRRTYVLRFLPNPIAIAPNASA